MKKEIFNIIFFSLISLFSCYSYGQTHKTDSLKTILSKLPDDSNKVNTLNALSYAYMEASDYPSSGEPAKVALALAEKIDFKRGQANAYLNLAWFHYDNNKEEALKMFSRMIDINAKLKDIPGATKGFTYISGLYLSEGNYPEAINALYKKLKIYEQEKDSLGIANTILDIGAMFMDQDDDEAMKKLSTSLKMFEKLQNKQGLQSANFYMGNLYMRKKLYNDALQMQLTALKYAEELNDNWMKAWALSSIASIYESQNKLAEAIKDYHSALKIFNEAKNNFAIGSTYLNLGRIYTKQKKYTLATEYFEKTKIIGKESNNKDMLKNLYHSYAILDDSLGRYKDAYKHHLLFSLYKDSSFNQEMITKSVSFKNKYEFEKKEAVTKAEQAKKDVEAKRVKNLQYTAIGIILLVAVFLFLNNRQKHKARIKIESAYADLKATQSQLIQAEKMASLGELTAGIAHEIQNPLNFVNNFSEVSNELIDEMKAELDKGDINEAKTIADDVKQNLEKINHHGKRADAIVKGMLQHSRSSSGTKEPTDINALCDEYLRLAYHGLRAKDPSFNATLKTDFDNSIGKINIIPQDIGRVILNLITNAFYAAAEKKKQQGNDYEPTVTVSTNCSPLLRRGVGGEVQVKVTDNGYGIPKNILNKIFQPFFTTKPTGQGTGLGLSLSYDIVTKGHGGELKVETKEGEGSSFIILLPIV